MKKLSINISVMLVIILSGGCKKQLDQLPTDSIDITKAFTSVADLEQGLLGVYSANNQTNKEFIATILADEAKLSSENRGQGQFEFKWQYSSGTGGVTAAYRQYFTMIDRIHRVQAGMLTVLPANTDETNRIARVKAELSALKGIAYYESLINFMPPGYDGSALGIAIVNESCLTCTPARNTVAEVMAQIESLQNAARLDGAIPNAPTDPTRLSKAAIAGYQSRVAMLKKDWAAAITYASDAITLSGKTLATGTTFIQYWSDANESESILKYRNQTSPRLLWRDSNGDLFFEPSIKLKSLFDRVNDIRFSTYFSAAGTDTSFVNKFKGSGFGASINDLQIIRLAELYLNRAEANAHSNKLAQAAADVQAIRVARGVAGTVTFASQAQAEAEVLNERFKELCFEGFRYYDLKRNTLPINRLASDVTSTEWQNLSATDYRYTLPIPTDAVLANPNTKQNPGY